MNKTPPAPVDRDTVETKTRQAERERALDRLAKLNWKLPEDYRFDRDEANER
jgi:antitoxin MazE